MLRPVILFWILVLLILPIAAEGVESIWNLPPLPPPEEYGNLLINRVSEAAGQKAVTFSHWSHRLRYTCRVCHTELAFEMKVNDTEITEKANRRGEYCGACHNGRVAFGLTRKNCTRCHNGDRSYGKEKFKKLAGFPKAKFGNKIDWEKAIRQKRIHPKATIWKQPYTPIHFNKLLKMDAKWHIIPDAFFSHKTHNQWLDCSNCHPEPFNIKEKTTKHFSMKAILQGRFCGTCHRSVSFPMNDCNRCHPGIKK